MAPNPTVQKEPKDTGSKALVRFESTSINMCLFQQPAVVRTWWAQVEKQHDLGFCARILFSFAKKSPMPPASNPMQLSRSQLRTDILQRAWTHAADVYGHSVTTLPRLCFSHLQGVALEGLVREVEVLVDTGGWGTASKGLLGKVEYIVASTAAFNHILESSLSSSSDSPPVVVSDCSIKAAMRFLDLRMLLGATVIDAEAAATPLPSKSETAHQTSEHADPDLATIGRVLRACPEDPLTFTDMSKHMVQFRKDSSGERRRSLLLRMEAMGLGICEEVAGRGRQAREFAETPVRFARHHLTPQIRATLQELQVPIHGWPGVMQGAGRKKQALKRPSKKPTFEKVTFCEKALQRPPDIHRVEEVINAHLLAHGPRVGGGPVEVKAAHRPAKKNAWFQLRCYTCNPKTCTWSGRAEYDPQRKVLVASELTGRKHGELKRKKAPSGRKPKGQASGPDMSVHTTADYCGELKQSHFHKWVMQYFAEKPLAESTRVLCKPRKATKNKLVCCFFCGTHVKCQWRGRAWLVQRDGMSPQVVMRHAAPDAHAKGDVVIRGTLTWLQRQVVARGNTTHTLHVDRDLKRLKRKAEDGSFVEVTPPSRVTLSGFMQRFRKKLRQPHFEPRSKGLDKSVFQYCVDMSNGSLGGTTFISLGDNRIDAADTQLRVVNPVYDGMEVTLPLICPALVHQILGMLPRPWHVKLSLDGTYRLLVCGNYVLLNAGVNIKHVVPAMEREVTEYRTRYVPLAFAVAHVESVSSYARMIESLLAVAAHTKTEAGTPFGPEHVGQWHGDLHRGLENARRRVCPNAVRVSDWAHCCGVTTPGPSGFPATAAKYLRSDSPLAPKITMWFALSRFLPKFVFHVLWSHLFREMEEPLQAALQREYFFKAEDVWSAHWRAAPDRIAPGTATGSAAQEAWHGKTLKQMIPHKQTPYGLARSLQTEIVEPLLAELQGMRRGGVSFEDWPGAGQHLNLSILKASGKMAREGRTCAVELLDWSLHTTASDKSGNKHFLFPVSKWRPAPDQAATERRAKKAFVLRSIPPLTEGAALAMGFKASLATSRCEAEAALQDLRVYNAQQDVWDWDQARELFTNWRHVVVGPAVEELWKLHGTRSDALTNKHGRALCFGCAEAAKSGPCEHVYAALLHLGEISVEPTVVTRRPGRPPKAPGGGRGGLSPGRRLVADVPPVCPTHVGAGSLEVEATFPLLDLLKAAGLQAHAHVFHEQGATMTILRDMTLADYRAFFGLTLSQAYRLHNMVVAATSGEGGASSSRPAQPSTPPRALQAAPAETATPRTPTQRAQKAADSAAYFRGLRQTYGP